MKLFFVFAAVLSMVSHSAEAKDPAKKNAPPTSAKENRKPAALEEGKCYANIGIVGTMKGVVREPREAEEILYLKDCLKYSSTDAVFEIPSTLPGVVPRHFIAKVKASEVPFVFGMGNFQYHLLNGEVIGVTKVRE